MRIPYVASKKLHLNEDPHLHVDAVVPGSNKLPKGSLANTFHDECHVKSCVKYIPQGLRVVDNGK